VVTPVEDAHAANEIDVVLTACLADTSGAWQLDADGTWHRIRPDGEPYSAQDALIVRALAAEDRAERAHLADETLERVVRRRGRQSGL
jgi:polyphosphate kinase